MQIAALRQLLDQRYPEATPLPHGGAPALSTGIDGLDAVLPGGGLPRATLTAWQAIASPAAVLRCACRTAMAAGERTAWIHTANVLDLEPAEVGGMLLLHAPSSRQALRSTEVLLRSGGLGLLVLDCAELDRPANIRLTRAAREGGTALVVMTRRLAIAALRLHSRFLADRMHWGQDPFGESALPRTAVVEIRVHALGWTRTVTITLPIRPYEFRLSPDPTLADRRGGGARLRPIEAASG